MTTPRLQRNSILQAAILLMAVSAAGSSTIGQAEPTPEQAFYWWQDEIRTACFALGDSQTGKVAQWPRIAMPILGHAVQWHCAIDGRARRGESQVHSVADQLWIDHQRTGALHADLSGAAGPEQIPLIQMRMMSRKMLWS